MGSPVVGSANFFLSYRPGGSRCDAGLQSELIIACRNCAAVRRVHIIQLARGSAASLARSHAVSPSSQDHSRRAAGFFPPVVPPSICTLSRARRHWPTRAVPPEGFSRPLSDRPATPALPFSRISRPCRSIQSWKRRFARKMSIKAVCLEVKWWFWRRSLIQRVYEKVLNFNIAIKINIDTL